MENSSSFGWLLVLLGLGVIGIGLIWILGPSIPWLGRLPGDVHIERHHFRFDFPIVTCLLLSVALSLLLWLIQWFRR